MIALCLTAGIWSSTENKSTIEVQIADKTDLDLTRSLISTIEIESGDKT